MFIVLHTLFKMTDRNRRFRAIERSIERISSDRNRSIERSLASDRASGSSDRTETLGHGQGTCPQKCPGDQTIYSLHRSLKKNPDFLFNWKMK